MSPITFVGVFNRALVDRGEEDAFHAVAARLRVLRQCAQVLRVARIHAREVFRERAGHHQPLGMQVHDVFAIRRRLRFGDQVDVDPRMHLQARAMRALEHERERIE